MATRTEEFKLEGGKILDKIKELIHQGHIRRITLKNEEGKTLIEIPSRWAWWARPCCRCSPPWAPWPPWSPAW